MSGELEFKVSQELIMPIIKAKINQAIIEAMGGKDRMIDDVLEAYMSQKVNEKGQVDSYSSSNKYKRVDILIHDLLGEAVKEALKDYLATKKEVLSKSFSAYFASKKGGDALARAMEDGITKALMNNWNTKITFEIPDRY